MESDYGWAINDAFEDEYGDADVLVPLCDVSKEEPDKGYEADDFIPLKTFHITKTKKVNGSFQSFRGQKTTMKRKRRRLTGPEEFFQLVLSWPIDKLIADGRKSLGLAPLAEMPSYFLNKLVYFDTMKQVAVEEARASLLQGLRIPSGQMELKMIKMNSYCEESSLVLILFKIMKGGLEMTRPGSAFKLFDATPNNFNQYNNGVENSNHSNKRSNCDTKNSYCNNKKLFINTNKEKFNKNQQERFAYINEDKNHDTTLAVVAQGSQAMSAATALGGFNSILPLWVHSSSPLGRQLISSEKDVMNDSIWKACSLGSLLSYQRMATVCYDSPSPPFMHKLLGHRQVSHIKFDSDSENDDDKEESEDEDGGDQGLNKKHFSASTSTLFSTSAVDNYEEPCESDSSSVSDYYCEKNDNNESDVDTDNNDNNDNHNNDNEEEDDDDGDNEIQEKNYETENVLFTVTSNRIKLLNKSQLNALQKCVGNPTFFSNSLSSTSRSSPTGNLSSTAKQTDLKNLSNNSTALSSTDGNLHLVLGPPGCGKTHFLVSLLHALICNEMNKSREGMGMKIMVCAPSNKAVCVVLEQFLQIGVVGKFMYKNERKCDDENENENTDKKINKSKSEERKRNKKGLRCALMGVIDKIEECSSSSKHSNFYSNSNSDSNNNCNFKSNFNSNLDSNMNKKTNSKSNFINNIADEMKTDKNKIFKDNENTEYGPQPFLPKSVTGLTCRFLFPKTAADVFAPTYGKGISSCLNAIFLHMKDAIGNNILLLKETIEIKNEKKEKILEEKKKKKDEQKENQKQKQKQVIGQKFQKKENEQKFDDDEISILNNKCRAHIFYLISLVKAYQSECRELFEIIEYDAINFFNRVISAPYTIVKEAFQIILSNLKLLLKNIVDINTISLEYNTSFVDPRTISSKDKSVNIKKRKEKHMEDRIDLELQIPDNIDASLCPSNCNNDSDNYNENDDMNIKNILITIDDNFPFLLSNLKDISNIINTQSSSEEISSAILQSCTIIFCTLTSSGSSIIKNNIFDIDVLIVDEAAQALEVELLIPLALGPKNLILVGDPKQLPACVLSIENQKLKRGDSTMQRLIEKCDYKFMLLDTQYRMHPAISKLPNQLYYDNELKDSDYVKKRKNIITLNNYKSVISSNINNNDNNKNDNDNDHNSNIDNDNDSKNNFNENKNKIDFSNESLNQCLLWKNTLPKWMQYYSFIDVSGDMGGKEGNHVTEKGGGKGGASLSNEAEASLVVR